MVRSFLQSCVLGAISGLAALGLAGCGGNSKPLSPSDTQGSTGTQQTAHTAPSSAKSSGAAKEKVPLVSIPVSIPISSHTPLTHYTCAGADTSLPLKWGKVPRKTVEVDVFIFQTLPVDGKLVPIWSLSGIHPSVHRITAGHTPSGATVGANAAGAAKYSLCPSKSGKQISYTAMVVPLSGRIPTKPSFDAEDLVKTAIKRSGLEGRIGFLYQP
jgi:phosphatidylethanolamine-binding protein (PEBP) family uncharacterized protein